MSNSRIPHEFTESIIYDEAMPPIHRVLHWYYRNMYGWEKRRKQGYFEVTNFTKEAKSIRMKKQQFMPAFWRLEKMGYFSVSVTKKCDKICHIIMLHSVIQKCDKRVTKKCDKLSHKNMTGNRLATTKSRHPKTLKQELKQGKKKQEGKQENPSPEIDTIFSTIQEIIEGSPLQNTPKSFVEALVDDYSGEKVIDTYKLLVVKWHKKQLNELGFHTVEMCLSRKWCDEPANKALLEEIKAYESRHEVEIEEQPERELSEIDIEVAKRLKADPFRSEIAIRRQVINEFNKKA